MSPLDLSKEFHPVPKPSHREPEKPQKAPTTPRKTPKATRPSPAKKPPPKKRPAPKKPPKRKPGEQLAYKMARDRCRVSGGFVCEHGNHFISAGFEHAHHILWGRSHGTRSSVTDQDLLAIVCGDFTPSEQQCHRKIHEAGNKTLEAFPYWRGNLERFEALSH